MTDINKNGDHGGRRFDEALAIQYLFGELSEAKKEEFEESYFDDDAFFERFLAVKNELLDLYARDELEPAVSTRMERAFLISDSRQNRIAETRDFIRSISTVADRDLIGSLPLEISGGKSGFLESIASFFSVPRFAGLAILLFGALGGIWLLLSPRENANLIGLNTPANSGQLNSDQDVSVRPGMSNTDSPSENL